MRIVATMIVRDEEDVIVETLEELSKHTTTIIVLDGGSTDGTVEKMRQFPHVKLIEVKSGENWDQMGERELLLNAARDASADWVISVDADEIYHTDPIKAIHLAEKEGATLIRCQIPQFLFTEKELADGTLKVEDDSLPVQQRRLWYNTGWSDFMIWKMQPGLTYLGGKDGRVTRPPYFKADAKRIEAKVSPILKHYQYRSLAQFGKKMKTRRRNCGKNHKRWFRYTYESPFWNEESEGFFRFDGTFYDKTGQPLKDGVHV